ncbi:hypothetical protein AVEN_274128-1 [Araneus ventricosus]|uniref:Uncharacterized protein n=1 Tax=Araneus ventricosus TaxID=182803 RepID=A0A4Y2RJP7_ARAVE|nr:hypothetical protein AVEN_274128-1 [Araneus ventricosus]
MFHFLGRRLSFHHVSNPTGGRNRKFTDEMPPDKEAGSRFLVGTAMVVWLLGPISDGGSQPGKKGSRRKSRRNGGYNSEVTVPDEVVSVGHLT